MKFNPGDIVVIVNYGNRLFTIHQDGSKTASDSLPGIVGRQGTVTEATIKMDQPSYSVSGIPEKQAYYNEDQLQLILQN